MTLKRILIVGSNNSLTGLNTKGGLLMIGHVKFFDGKRGFGFITEHETGNEYFVSVNDVTTKRKGKGNLGEGQPVSFELGKDKNGRVCSVEVTALSIEDILKRFTGKPGIKIELKERPEQCFNPALREALGM